MVTTVCFCSCISGTLLGPVALEHVRCGKALPTSLDSSEPALPSPFYCSDAETHQAASQPPETPSPCPSYPPKGRTKCFRILHAPVEPFTLLLPRGTYTYQNNILYFPTPVDQWFSKRGPWTSTTTIIT